VTAYEVRDNRRRLVFDGELLGEVSSRRAAPRWTELSVYRTGKTYLWARVGRSVIAHRAECPKVTWQMTKWADLDDAVEVRLERLPCGLCQPVTWPHIDPQSIIETSRYQAVLVGDPAALVELISRDHVSSQHHPLDKLPMLTRRLVYTLLQSDPAFAKYWSTVCPDTSTIKP